MIRLDLSYFYRLRATHHALRELPADVELTSVWGVLFNGESVVRGLLQDENVGVTFRRAHAPGLALYELVSNITNRPIDQMFTQYDKVQLDRLLDTYEAVLQSELSVADAYFVVPKPGLDTLSLVTAGEVLFPKALSNKVPEAVGDLREAGRCIAYELCTAAGFHLMRAVETVMRRYWEVATGNAPKPRQRNIGTYLRGLRRLDCGDEKVMGALEQLTKLHRNVIIHTNEALTLDKAISLVGMARSVVDAMLDEIPEPPIEVPTPPAESPEFPTIMAGQIVDQPMGDPVHGEQPKS